MASLCQDGCTLELQVLTSRGKMQFKGYQTSPVISTSNAYSMCPLDVSFVPTGTSIPLIGDVCFLVSVLRSGIFLYFFNRS